MDESPLSLILKPQQPSYPATSLPDFQAIVKNLSKKPMRFCAYMLRARIFSTMTAEHQTEGLDYHLLPFKPGKYPPLKAEDIRTIPPGKTLAVTLSISTSKVWGFVTSGSQPPVIPSGHKIGGFGPGVCVFRAHFDSSMAIYQGTPEMYDRNWEWRDVPEDLPGVEGKLDDVFRGKCKAKVQIKFG